MRIAMFSGYPYPMSIEEPLRCGGQYGPFYLSRALAAQGHKVDVICRARKRDKKYQKLDGVNIHRYISYSHIGGNRQSTSFSLHRLGLFKKLISKYKFDIVNTQTPIVLESLIAKRRNLPLIYISQGVVGMYAKNLSFSLKDLLNKAAMRFSSIPAARYTFKNCDKIVGVAKDDVARIRECFDIKQERLAVIHNGVDLDSFNTDVNGNRIRDTHKLTSRDVILYVGRIHPHKGIHHIISAASIVLRDFPDAFFLLVGVPDSIRYQEQLVEHISMNKLDEHVRIVNNVPEREKPEYYRAADMSIIFSEGYDPAPNTIIESMACGLPIIWLWAN